jgi:hypothetical protein
MHMFESLWILFDLHTSDSVERESCIISIGN